MIDIFKRWFSHSKEQDIDDSQNPWAGLASYEDPETAERKLKFCGRDYDSYDLARLIMGNVFVTLYGKSGIGKTSLLNAGVFPELREQHCIPVSIRLGMRDDEHPQSYQTMIVEAIERVVKRTETINVINEQQNQQSIDYLWNYFARHRFYNKFDEPTTPVTVFDQFEEVFRGFRDEAETLLRQLDFLNDKDHTLDNCEVDDQPYRYDQNFRFVVSIREDDLYCLEDSIDNCYLPALKRCRYRLRSLSEEGALDAILIPGEGLFNQEEKDSITQAIISKSRNDDGSISTNIISLLCNRIFVDLKKSGADHISLSLVENFIKGNPFERFYNEATLGFSYNEKCYIEDHLIDGLGRRNSIPERDFFLHVKNGSILLKSNTRILQRINNRIELIHDSFCVPLIEKKKKRILRKRFYITLLSFFSINLIIIILVSFISIVSTNEKMLENQVRFISEKASTLVDEGDSYLAQLLMLEVLPDIFNIDDRLCIEEAENALRKACMHRDNSILRGHKKAVCSAVFSPDGKYILSSSKDKTIRVWDSRTGRCLWTLIENMGQVSSAAYSPNGKRIVSAHEDGTIRVWDTSKYKSIVLKEHTGRVSSVAYTPNGKYIVSVSADSTIRIWDAGKNKPIFAFRHPTSIRTFALSPDSKRIVSVSCDNVIRVWDIDNGKIYGRLINTSEDNESVLSVFISPNGENIVSVVSGFFEHIRMWDIKTLSPIHFPIKRNRYIPITSNSSVAFSPDGKFVVSSSENNISIWDSYTEEVKQVINLMENSTEVLSIAFSPDGKRIVSSFNDFTIHIMEVKINSTHEDIYAIPLQQLIDETRERFKDRQLTPEERRKYYLE